MILKRLRDCIINKFISPNSEGKKDFEHFTLKLKERERERDRKSPCVLPLVELKYPASPSHLHKISSLIYQLTHCIQRSIQGAKNFYRKVT